MKRLLALVVLILLLFYGAWPAWTGYRIRQAVETQDAALLESKVDFPSVRASLKPVIAAEVEKAIEKTKADGGALASIIAGQIKGDFASRLIEAAIATTVTPGNVLRIIRDGKSVKAAIEGVLAEQMTGGAGAGPGNKAGGFGGLFRLGNKKRQGQGETAGAEGGATPSGTSPAASGDAGEPPPVPPERRRLSLANIKRFSIDGPLAFSVGVARDPASSEPDITAQLAFTGADWKVVGIIPRPLRER